MYKISRTNISGGPSAPTARVVLLTNIPSSDSMAEVHPAMISTTVTNLGQVELDLEITNTGNGNKSDNKGTTSKGAATGNGTRKKSSSALQAEEEEGGSGKKTSKSSDDSEREHSARVSELRDAHAQCAAQTANCGLININPDPEASLVTTEATDQPQEALACKDNTGDKKTTMTCLDNKLELA